MRNQCTVIKKNNSSNKQINSLNIAFGTEKKRKSMGCDSIRFFFFLISLIKRHIKIKLDGSERKAF